VLLPLDAATSGKRRDEEHRGDREVGPGEDGDAPAIDSPHDRDIPLHIDPEWRTISAKVTTTKA
jgi:hypothetical protein